MPSVLKIDQRRRIVFSSFYGRVTDEELLEHRNFIARDPDFNADFNEIVDFTGVTASAVSSQAIAALAANQSLFKAESMHVLVVSDGRIATLAGKFVSMARPTRPKLFVVRTLPEAYKLLADGAR